MVITTQLAKILQQQICHLKYSANAVHCTKRSLSQIFWVCAFVCPSSLSCMPRGITHKTQFAPTPQRAQHILTK